LIKYSNIFLKGFQEKPPPALQREYPIIQNINSLFSSFLSLLFAFLDPEPDPASKSKVKTKLNPN
jgi:hypothetical protein